jgi:hypothetical protein
MAIPVNKRSSIGGSCRAILVLATLTAAAALFSQSAAHAAARSANPIAETPDVTTKAEKDFIKMSENQTPPGATEMAAAKTLTTKVLALGT